MKKQYLAWLWPVLWMMIIFFLSHQPASASSGMSSGIARQLFGAVTTVVPLEFETVHTLLRKSTHFFAYFVLGLLLLYALRKSGGAVGQSMVWAFIGSALYAASDEAHQLFIPGRSGEMRDVLIDSAGAAAGLLLYWLFFRFKWHMQRKAETTW